MSVTASTAGGWGFGMPFPGPALPDTQVIYDDQGRSIGIRVGPTTRSPTYRGIPLSELPVRELQQAARALAAARVVREPLLVGRVSTVPPCSAEAVRRLRAATYGAAGAGRMVEGLDMARSAAEAASGPDLGAAGAIGEEMDR